MKSMLYSAIKTSMPAISATGKQISKKTWKYTPKDLRYTTVTIKNATKRGLKKSTKKGIFGKTTAIAKEYKKLKYTKDEAPALAAAIVSIIPIPSPIPITPVVYVLGRLINKSMQIFK